MKSLASATERPVPSLWRSRRRHPRPPRYQHHPLRRCSGFKKAALGETVAPPPAVAVADAVQPDGCRDGDGGRNDKTVVVAAASVSNEDAREHGIGGAVRQPARYRSGSDRVAAAAAPLQPAPLRPTSR